MKLFGQEILSQLRVIKQGGKADLATLKGGPEAVPNYAELVKDSHFQLS